MWPRANSPRTTQCWSSAWSASPSGSAARSRRRRRRGRSCDLRARNDARRHRLAKTGSSMQQRALGNSGLIVSAVGLGGNNFGGRLDLAATRAVVHKALDLGVTLIDTADVYGNKGGSESYLGEVLGARRKEIVLATKFGLPTDAEGELKGASRAYIMQAVEASLERLRADWIDLEQLPRPARLTPIEETLRALDDLVRQGKVRHIGCSNLGAAQIMEAQEVSARHQLAAFVTCQDEYS